MITENEIIEKLCNEPFCLFLGSGISHGVGLPLGNELGKMIVEALDASDKRSEDIADKYHLERMLFLMKPFLGQSIHGAYSALNSHFYGKNHHILAILNKEKNVPLLTTNQDELIELALGADYSYKNFVKIHGTISDPDSLRITLDRVSNLSSEMFESIVDIARGRIIVVVGYSFSDYDLREFFLSSKSRLYYCAFEGKTNKFLSETLWKDEPEIYENHCFASTAESFLTNLAEGLGLSIQYESPQIPLDDIKESQDKTLERWASQYLPYLRIMAVACLPQGLWQGRETFLTMEKLADDKKVPPFYRAIALAEASRAAEGQASYREQRLCLNRLKTAQQLDRNIHKLIYSVNMAAYHHIQDNPLQWAMGLRLYRKAKALLPIVSASVTQEEATVLDGYSKIIEHGIASSLEKLSRFFTIKNKLQEAMNLMTPYVENSKPCDLDFLCEALFIRAKLYVHMRDIDKAESDYRRALDIAYWIKKNHSIDQAHRSLGRIMGIKGEFKEALYHLQKSYDFANKTHERLLVARNHLTQAWLYGLMGKPKESREKKINGEKLYKELRGKIIGSLEAYLYLKGR